MEKIPKGATKFKGATREKVRKALARVLEEDEVRASTKAVSVAKVRGAGGGDQNAITELVRLWRAGHLSVSDSWDDAPVAAVQTGPAGQPRGQAADDRVNLMERIRAATTDGDREAIAQEVGALVAGGVLAPDEAAQIKGALGEARLAAEARRANEPPPEDPTKMLLASPEALEAARALDMLVGDARRDQALSYIAAQLELDRAEFPHADEGGGA